MTILFLCHGGYLCREQLGYVRAFMRHGARLAFVPDGFPANGDLNQLLRQCPEKPFLILHPELQPVLPIGLTDVSIPTACFQIDTYTYTGRRIKWSMLFDYSLLFHSGFEDEFRDAGHPRPLTSPHAVDPDFFPEEKAQRLLEISMVGRTDGRLYKSRREILSQLSTSFRMNEWWREHSYQELADVYRHSKIVVNIGRDDYPFDTGLRFAEAMAAGALFLTLQPGQLPHLGFENGNHFVGYRRASEIADLARFYLSNEPLRRRIAEAGREKVLREYTYDCRVKALLEKVRQDGGHFFAPARGWSPERVSVHYLDYYAAHLRMDCAYRELQRIGLRRPISSAVGSILIAGALSRRLHSRFLNISRAGSGPI